MVAPAPSTTTATGNNLTNKKIKILSVTSKKKLFTAFLKEEKPTTGRYRTITQKSEMKKGNADRKWRRNEPVILKVPVPVRERLFTKLAAHRLLAGVELLDVEPEVGLAPTGGGTELTLVLGLVSGIYNHDDISMIVSNRQPTKHKHRHNCCHIISN